MSKASKARQLADRSLPKAPTGIAGLDEVTGGELPRSLGFDLGQLVEEKKVLLDHVRVEPGDIEETGAFDLAGLFIREGVLTGSARIALEASERAAELSRRQQIQPQQRELDRKQKALQAQLAALQAELDSATEESHRLAAEDAAWHSTQVEDRDRMRQRRDGRNGETPADLRPPARKVKGERA